MTIDWTDLGTALGSWSLTLLLHATVLLAAAALASLALRRRPELEEALWKAALIGGLLTASLQPVVADWRAERSLSRPPDAALHVASPVAAAAGGAATTARPAGNAASAIPLRLAAWRGWLAAGWGLGAVLLLARLAGAWVRLRRRLAGRRPVADGPLRLLVDRLVRAAGWRREVSLTHSAGIPVPIALRREICLPERALRELPLPEQETAVAHEMAHVVRRDPVWLLVCRAAGAVLFFHPLVHLAGRRLRRLAELRCDDWAAAATGKPLALARCLTRVAGWGSTAAPAPAMAGDRRWLASRVTRLVERGREQRVPAVSGWLRPAACGLVLIGGLWLPGVSLAGDAPPPAAAPAAPAAPAEPVLPPDRPVAVVAPEPVLAPAPPPPPQAPAVAIPAPGPLPPEELARLEGELAAELAEIEAHLAAVADSTRLELSERRRRELTEEARLLAERARDLEVERHRERAREHAAALRLEREELRRLAEEMTAERQREAELLAAEQRRIAAELAAQRRELEEQARRLAAEAGGSVAELEVTRQQQRELARQLGEEAEEMRTRMRLEMERLAPELERMRAELRLREEERRELLRELESLRREVETLRDQHDG